MRLQTQQTAELLRPFREALLLDAYHSRGIMGHNRHACLEDGPLMAFVPDVPCASAQQALNTALDDWPACTHTRRQGALDRGCADDSNRPRVGSGGRPLVWEPA